MVRRLFLSCKRLVVLIVLPYPGISTRIRPLLNGYSEIRRVVPGFFPIFTFKPMTSLMMLLLPALGLPVNTKYFSNMPITTGKTYLELAYPLFSSRNRGKFRDERIAEEQQTLSGKSWAHRMVDKSLWILNKCERWAILVTVISTIRLFISDQNLS
jgi:hypothetical protein